ncbi:MAG: hypothetical protein JJ902_05800 [Roseibium sp.]|nr:hypothetical protein [Roseibium sp.]
MSCSLAIAADKAHNKGDFFVISRGADGGFLGSHKIFREQQDGLHEVFYCGRPYWVRTKTVAWTQLEQEKKREVRVEFNRGRGWRPLCNRPSDQVTLEDLGYSVEPHLVVINDGIVIERMNRFSAIKKSFHKSTGDVFNKTFHGR